MNVTIERWIKSLSEINLARFPRKVEAIGVCDQFLGSRPAYAKVELRFEPFDYLDFDSGGLTCGQETDSFLENISFGVIDVLMTSSFRAPMLCTKISVMSMSVHDIESTAWAFRMAARDATRRAVETVTLEPIPTNPNESAIHTYPRIAD